MAGAKKPYVSLGKQLKQVREQFKRSLAEVSGAVEIDESQLRLIEAGMKRPEEDVMLLLISYFNMADKEALQLWQLADYDSDLSEHLDMAESSDDPLMQQLSAKPTTIMLVSMDVRTMYSDGVEVTWNDAGVTLNFTQTVNKGQGVSVSKVGMSHKQLENVLKCLERAMLHSKYGSPTKLLPPGNQKKDDVTGK